MAVIVKRLNYPAAPTSGGGGGSADKHLEPFVVGDWALNGAQYELTVLASTHEKGTNPVATVYYDNTVTHEEVEVPLTVNGAGDIKIYVTSTPDNRFKGKLVII